jgi:hypothetical protein
VKKCIKYTCIYSTQTIIAIPLNTWHVYPKYKKASLSRYKLDEALLGHRKLKVTIHTVHWLPQ